MKFIKFVLLTFSLVFTLSMFIAGLGVFYLVAIRHDAEAANQQMFLVVLFAVLAIPPGILFGAICLHDLMLSPETDEEGNEVREGAHEKRSFPSEALGQPA